tara:strand:+ start:1386 stop:1574 length:189 start_codon:yes stop_codon:yes gene_type:complete
MKIIIDGIETEVKVNDEFLEGTFLETLYEWLDSNDIHIEFEENYTKCGNHQLGCDCTNWEEE